MNPFVRRSHLLVSISDREAVESSWTHNADAVILDLTGASSDAERFRRRGRKTLSDSIEIAGRGGAEVFVLVDKSVAHADIEAAIWPGAKGILYPGAETAAEIADVDELLTDLEQCRGIASDALHVIVLLETGAGIWNIREIIRASPRVSSVGLNELVLCANMGITPTAGFDPFEYAKGRVIIEGRASKVQPIGMSHPYGALPEFDDDAEIARLALRSKNLGFAGAICPNPSWIAHCNRAFAPPEDQLDFYRETRRLFAEGVARGTAAVPYPGTTMMIDVPVDENARVNLELWELCAAREAEKAIALARARS
ncbi:MAG: aldolase/citrate lyase family protein [Dehalococcoidia bacterium]|nr:aldolase/citrate lyase family protein [Dehalococcoidia bacterium]